jgi:hypothetical protein
MQVGDEAGGVGTRSQGHLTTDRAIVSCDQCWQKMAEAERSRQKRFELLTKVGDFGWTEAAHLL